jgi:hypothetical protein
LSNLFTDGTQALPKDGNANGVSPLADLLALRNISDSNSAI